MIYFDSAATTLQKPASVPAPDPDCIAASPVGQAHGWPEKAGGNPRPFQDAAHALGVGDGAAQQQVV